MKYFLLLLTMLCLSAYNPQNPVLKISVLGNDYKVHEKTLISQLESDQGGNTSIRNNESQHLVWKSKGYYQRNRDLGQVFTLKESRSISAVVLRTGPDDKAVLPGAIGSELFLQFYEVTGEPSVNDNGTPPGTKATHGFSDNHRCDDFIDGMGFEQLVIYDGGILPVMSPTFDSNGETGDHESKLTYLRFELNPPLDLDAGKYAFMVGFSNPGEMRGLTLANANRAHLNEPPAINDGFDLYGGGWGLRREGNGQTPPTMILSETEPNDADLKNSLLSESSFPEMQSRFQIDPTSDGYPDVDTYRDLTFAIEVN